MQACQSCLNCFFLHSVLCQYAGMTFDQILEEIHQDRTEFVSINGLLQSTTLGPW